MAGRILSLMTLSARNRLEGKVDEIQFGGVTAHVVSWVPPIRCSDCGAVSSVGEYAISYMYLGAWQTKDGSSGHEFHVGPHLMIVGPRQDDFQGFNRDPSNGMPYVAHLPHRTELYLVMPVRQWDE